MKSLKVNNILAKGSPLRITIIYATFCFVLWFLFSDFVITNLIVNSKITHLISVYRGWVFYIFSVALVYHLVYTQFKKFTKADIALKKSKDSYQILLENLRENYFFYRHDLNSEFENITPSIKNILGFTPKEFKENYRKYHAEKLVGDYISRHEKAFMTGIKFPPYEVDILDKNNTVRILEIKEIPIINDEGKVIAVESIAHDITEIRHLENDLDQKENKFQILFESCNDAIIILKGEKIIDCNQKAVTLFGSDLDQIIMQSPYSYKFSPPLQSDGSGSFEKGREYILNSLSGQTQFFKWDHIKLNGEPFTVQSSISRFRFNNEDHLLLNIRELKDSILPKENLLLKDEYYQTIYENSFVGLYQTTIADGFLLKCNNAAREIFGLNPSDELNKINFSVSSLYLEKDRRSFIDILENKGNIFNHEICLTLTDGTEKYVSVSAVLYKEKGIIEGSIIDVTSKKKSEILIHQNEKQFREILENSRDILYKLNAVSGDYEYISPSVKDVLGYSSAEILKMDVNSLKKLLHPDDLGMASNVFAKLIAVVPLNKNNYSVEYRMKNKNGEYRWLSDNYRIIKNENGETKSIIGNVIDITIRKEAQNALKESELRFRKMAENIQNGVTINEKDKNVYVNERLVEITGYSKLELLSFSEFQIAAPEEKKRLQMIITELKKSGDKIEELEFWIVKKDGTRRCILNRYSYNYLDEGTLVKYIISVDITDRKLMENALREREEKFKYLADLLPQTVFECDLEGNLTYVNGRGLKQFGFSREDFDAGINIFNTIDKDYVKPLRYNFNKLIKEEKFESQEYLAKRKDGSFFPIMVYTSLIKTNEKLLGVRGIIIDTSNQKRIQEELILAKEAAEAANKAKTMFLTNISHELRTPMNSIFGMTELIKKTNLSEKQYDFLKIITESSENLLSFINDIIIIPQIETEQLVIDHKPFKLQDLLASVVGVLSYQAEVKKVKLIESQKFDNDCVVFGDPIRLNQILLDLAELFLKYTSKGEIDICIKENHRKDNTCDIDFIIRKTGKELPAQMLKELKTDFARSHVEVYNKFGSYGLGLIIANQLVRILGSELIIETSEKETLVKFNLKLIYGTVSDLEKYSFTGDQFFQDHSKYLKNLKILLVEDEIFNQLVIEALVEEWDCEVDVAENGKEAIDKFGEKKFDVVLLDIQLPDMNGFEVSKLIRKKFKGDKKNIPLIAITAGISDYQKEFAESGIDYYIAKPFKSKELFHVLVKSLVNKDKINNSEFDRKIEKHDLKELYNLKIIENIAKNNKVLIIKMIRVFLDKARDEVKFLKIYALSNDLVSIKKMIHKMKPAISYMGINFINNDLEQIQFLADSESNNNEIKKIVSDIDYKMSEVFKLLEEEIVRYS